jgi:arylsulfatase A-like enzyme
MKRHGPPLLVLAALLFALGLAAIASCGRRPAIDRIFLVTIDTLRTDHLGFQGYPRNTSPFLDALSRRSVVFRKAFSSANLTGPSHASIFTSLHPPQHMVYKNGVYLNEAYLTMAGFLQKRGYETAAFTSVRFLKGLKPGFEVFRRNKSEERKHIPAPELADGVIAWLENERRSDKLFLWIHFFDVHQWRGSQNVDANLLGRIGAESALSAGELVSYLEETQGVFPDYYESEPEQIGSINKYDAQILAVDMQIERLFSAVERMNLQENTLWIFTSDHGEGLGSHRESGHSRHLYNEQLHVFLTFHFTDGRHAGRKIEQLVRHVDILPTVAELLGASLDGQMLPVEGRSLLPLMRGDRGEDGEDTKRLSFSKRRHLKRDHENVREKGWEEGNVYSLQDLSHKYIRRIRQEDEFYDLALDPLELNNLNDRPSARKEWFRETLESEYARMVGQVREMRPEAVNPRYRDELRALGYID